ncbi:dihydrolipoamide succinyltransferase [Sinorhizobium medicae]|uniref:dihydrolipoamide acetyltransferase family protein n=1 Tax=Sinorhizobium medicae TaxID=110321 RepID=UPI000C7DA51D|nr:2-oxo acid dehydrogenase subunit E2 [Sinorhizobium medicae]PLU10910.1 dihydrolipoamide succinyltransferase [Sinorhizobium medicae]
MGDLIDIQAPLEQEGTKAVVRNWLREIGEKIKSGDPLVELETDKVTQEVAAPADGVLVEILMRNGDDARPGAVLGRIGSELAGGEDAPHYSPAVRRAAEEYGFDPATITGTGRDGRVTRADMDRAFAARQAGGTSPEPRPDGGRGEPGSSRIPHSSMRAAIAEHMLNSVMTAPHVTAVFEADFSVNLSYTAYIVLASVAAMRAVPEVNSRWHEDALETFDDINIGVGISLGGKGLVVPVIRRAQNLSLAEIAALLQDLTTRARSNALSRADVTGGTFTISNHGVSGSLLATPIIINQPQSAILGVGKLDKRVVVREVDGIDTIQIRPMAYVSLTIDHRALDGHHTNAWLTEFVRVLESWPS